MAAMLWLPNSTFLGRYSIHVQCARAQSRSLTNSNCKTVVLFLDFTYRKYQTGFTFFMHNKCIKATNFN